MYTVVFTVMGPRDIGTRLDIDTKALTKVPGIAAERTRTDEVSLDTVMTGILEHTEIVKIEVGEVVVYPQGVEAIEISTPWGPCRPLTTEDVDADVPVFPCCLVVVGPRTEASGDTECPRAVHTGF